MCRIRLIQSIAIFLKKSSYPKIGLICSLHAQLFQFWYHQGKYQLNRINTYIWKCYLCCINTKRWHYSDVIMRAMASQITGASIVCLNVSSSADQRKHQSSSLQAFVRGVHRWLVDSHHKWPVTRKMFPFDDVTLETGYIAMMSEMAWSQLGT